MKTQLKAQLLQHLISKKKENEGFTLIELLVVIIIIGILSAIALPAFLNQANRARQSEAVTYVGSVNRGQQAYRLENPEFAPTIDLLGLGIQTKTKFYVYGDGDKGGTATPNDTIELSNFSEGAGVQAAPIDTVLLGYAGATYTLQLQDGNATTTAVLCTGENPGEIDAPGLTGGGTKTAKLTVTNTKECS
jgi:type IV pilus assembly protein PilA